VLALSDYLHSPAWWITAGVLGLLRNILGAFAVRGIDRWGGQFITRWSARTAAKKRRTAQLIAGVRADPTRLIWVGFQAQSLKTSSLYFFAFGAVLLLGSSYAVSAMLTLDEVTRWILTIAGGLALWVGMLLGSRGADLEIVIRAVEPEWPEPASAEITKGSGR